MEKLAAKCGKPIEQIMEQIAKACDTFVEQTGKILENVYLYAEPFKNLDEIWCVRPPSEIKKELKHEKNPMRVKQLNRELNESCLFYKKKIK